jgi:hypothetical protein
MNFGLLKKVENRIDSVFTFNFMNAFPNLKKNSIIFLKLTSFIKEGTDTSAVISNESYFSPCVKILIDSIYSKPSSIKFFELLQNYPNPFNPETTIPYRLAQPIHIELEIYNTLGQKIRTLVDATQDIGLQHTVWNGLCDQGQAVSSGVYYYVIKSKGFYEVRKMVLLR